MNLKPLGTKVVVRRSKPDLASKGGILLPEVAKKKSTQGVVLAVGPGKMLDNGIFHPIDLHPGQTVLFTEWSGHTLPDHAYEDITILEAGDILAVLEGAT